MSAEKMKVCFFKRKAVVLIVFFLLLFVIGVVVYPKVSNYVAILTAGGSDNWGLSFQNEGEPPIANATSEFLSGFDAYYIGDSSEKNIYLTFDAGYENGCTEQILSVLQKHNVKATFFLVGSYIRENPDIVKKLVDGGQIIGNHTNTHPDMGQISDLESFSQELNATAEAYKEVTGQEMSKYYRPPQGKYNEENLAMAQELGYKTIFWSLAYVDWYEDDQPTKEEAFAKLIPRIHNGAIVLLHSTSKTNAEILDELLTEWEKLGYKFKSLDELP
jgi:peptidoglycan-N-acetylmuramic acid deacetylase